MFDHKVIILSALLIVSCFGETSKDLISVQPTSVTNQIESKVVFTFREGVEIEMIKLGALLDNVPLNLLFCSYSSISGQSLTCTVKFSTGTYTFQYNKVLQENIKLLVEKVTVASFSPTITLASDVPQTVTLTFNRLPLPSAITYGIAKATATCSSVSDNDLQMTCQMTFSAVGEYEFLLDKVSTKVKNKVIEKTALALKSVTPNTVEQSLTAHQIKVEFSTVQDDMSEIAKIVFFGNDSPNKCELDSGMIYNCEVVLKTPGELSINLGGIKSNIIMTVTASDLAGYYYSLSLIILLYVFIL